MNARSMGPGLARRLVIASMMLAAALPAAAAPAGQDETSPAPSYAISASGSELADTPAQRRAHLVKALIAKWGASVAETYRIAPQEWESDMAETFATVPVSTLERALSARTFDAMSAILVPTSSLGSLMPKALGDAATDLVFVPITPCRIADTRLAGGQIATNTTRGFDVTAVSNYSFQGGSATNCDGAGAAGSFAAAAFNITVVTPPAAGYITAFPVNTTMPLAATVNYVAGDIRGNFAIVKLDQGALANELSIFAATATHVVIDMVGYFIQSQVTALDCVELESTVVTISGSSFGTRSSPSCATGYTITGGGCSMSNFDGRLVTSRTIVSGASQTHFCAFRNEHATNAVEGIAYARCCRIPGRP